MWTREGSLRRPTHEEYYPYSSSGYAAFYLDYPLDPYPSFILILLSHFVSKTPVDSRGFFCYRQGLASPLFLLDFLRQKIQ